MRNPNGQIMVQTLQIRVKHHTLVKAIPIFYLPFQLMRIFIQSLLIVKVILLFGNNKILKYTTTNRDGYKEYKSCAQDCQQCPLRAQCTESKAMQKLVTRHIWEEYIERAEDVRHSPLGKETYSMRSKTIERVFADAKEKHGMRYTQYRGLTQVTNWVRLKYAAMNLKKLATWEWNNSLFAALFSTFYPANVRTAVFSF